VTLKSAPAYFVVTYPVSKMVIPYLLLRRWKSWRALSKSLFSTLFYDGEEPPKLPILLKRKSSVGIAWGSSGKDARYLSKLRRLMGKTDEEHRKLVMSMAQKMARH
jgi:hypothetical protein